MLNLNRPVIGWLVVALGVAGVGACEDNTTTAGPPKLDVLFVIDDSGDMNSKQRTLAAAFPRLLDVLDHLPGGPPDLHVGVISSSVAAGKETGASCSLGDRGVLQVPPECGLDPQATGTRFLALDAKGNANFTGGLAVRFACLAQLGSLGCGFEHHLQSLRLALDQTATPENRGFLRADAQLAIVILADEDDCSAEASSTLFDGAIAGQSGSARCALRGHICGGQPIPAEELRRPLVQCAPYMRQPGDGGDRLIDVGDVVAVAKAAKGGDGARVVVSVITGWSASPEAVYAMTLEPSVVGGRDVTLASICEHSAVGSATPGIRLVAFARAFEHHTVDAICAPDLGPAMAGVGREIAESLPVGQAGVSQQR
jgi:hypothetical protein